MACEGWLTETFDVVRPRVVLALGAIAWRSAWDELRRREWAEGPRPRFAHAARVALEGDRILLGSYHPSQQNTFTGRLTESMLEEVFAMAREHLNRG